MKIGGMPEIIVVNPGLALDAVGFACNAAARTGKPAGTAEVHREVNALLHVGNRDRLHFPREGESDCCRKNFRLIHELPVTAVEYVVYFPWVQFS